MADVRNADFAGSWYPSSASACEKEIRQFIDGSDIRIEPKREFTGGIVPHAGWFFSGSIACNVINCLQEGAEPDVIAVFGMHLHRNSSCYIMKEGAWDTPFGEIEIEKDISEKLLEKFSFNIETPRRYTQDNTIELQLPFIKYFFKDVKIIPVGVPPDENKVEIGKIIADEAGKLGLNLKVIGSTDLTHYGLNYGFTPKGTGRAALDWVRDENDSQVIKAMLDMDPVSVIHEAEKNQNACCAGAAAAAIAAGKALGAEKAETLAYATSHDKSPGESFVGYVGVLF